MSSEPIYASLYYAICEDRKAKCDQYQPGSGLHKHHIKPKHMGGSDNEDNFTYLTQREHKIAHFLLWKIYKNVNDLRAMHMLGAELSTEKRRIVGKWCYENKKGMHAMTTEQKSAAASAQLQKRIDSGNYNEWDFWASMDGRRLRASMGGKKSVSGSKHVFRNYTKEQRVEYGRAGGKAAPTLPACNDMLGITKKFHTEEERLMFVFANEGWRCGHHLREMSAETRAHKVEAIARTKEHNIKNGAEYRTVPVTNGTDQKKLRPSELGEFLKENPEWRRGYNGKGRKEGPR